MFNQFHNTTGPAKNAVGVSADSAQYWKRQLADPPPALVLPADRMPGPIRKRTAAVQSLTVSPEATRHLRDLGKGCGATSATVLMSAFGALMYRLTGQRDLIIKATLGARSRPVRCRFANDQAFAQLLENVRDTVMEALIHSDVDWTIDVDAVSGGASFRYDDSNDAVGYDEQSHLKLPHSIELHAIERDDEIELNLIYQRELFSESRAVHLLEQYTSLLRQCVDCPDLCILLHSLVTDRARKSLPNPGKAIEQSAQQPITELIAQVAAQHPDLVAIEHNSQSWTYRQLIEKATSIAITLRDGGIEPGDVVAISGDRCFGLIAAMIGVMRAGGVMMLIDSETSPERQRLMLHDAGCRIMIDLRTWHRKPESSEWPVVRIALDSAISMRLVGATDTAELPLTRDEDPAHVFFSTDEDGIHKGVLGCHKALSHFATWQRDEFAINSGDRLAQLTPISNDTVLCEIMTPLISGATVCITEDEVLFCGDALLQWLDDQHITMIHAAPALASHWLSDLTGPVTLNSLRLLFFKDEPLTNNVVRRWQHVAPNARIINLYGPTETTLAKTWHDVSIDAHVLHDAGIQPIGKALPQTQVLLLNEYEQVCGIGETGQIVIRTPHRSMGFINPYESNEGFAPNPYTDDLSDLFFETGDIGRYRPDGSIELQGERHNTITHRGAIVAVPEIGAIPAEHPAVEECCVHVSDELTAYIVQRDPRNDRSDEIRQFLADRLPAHYMPAQIVTLAALPLTADGRIDRSELPERPQKNNAGAGQ